MTGAAPQLRRATAADSEACFRLFWDSISDLAARNGTPWEGTADDRWPGFDALYALLAEIAAEWWVAEDAGDERLIGYARSVERGADRGLFELSEFFVRPGHQSAGVGRALLERAFPIGRGEVRVIVATGDVRALARYHGADTSIQFPILGLNGAPSADAARTVRLGAEPITDPTGLDEVAGIERAVLGHDRGPHELGWLLERREAYRYRDGGRTVAFAFVGPDGVGPIAALEPEHLPDVLRHVEARAAAIGREELGFEVPAPNVVAVRHLLGRGFRLDPFVTYLMANRPFGRFDRYLDFTPPFVL
ncbi:MAG TPA: GNAT family N-acetyltransferase [Patescibacteria group bacterium]|nr:GNAT family N-acetyltransferase [Patescibacteria group bacterium]